eukprot:TRINITY_DN5421_c0_g1_i1.p1 TRINITY_DN5421_c0_g1~~TRINITY_DN5421_c0_g1_i1.p1  ORF type:complete len:980 (+),score=163.86 TRINITY_DN5421_c0_g1_i1:69-3008(+)
MDTMDNMEWFFELPLNGDVSHYTTILNDLEVSDLYSFIEQETKVMDILEEADKEIVLGHINSVTSEFLLSTDDLDGMKGSSSMSPIKNRKNMTPVFNKSNSLGKLNNERRNGLQQDFFEPTVEEFKTIPEIIDELEEMSPMDDYYTTFFLSYRSFISPKLLLKEIINRFQSYTDEIKQVKCIIIIEVWLTKYAEDFDAKKNTLVPLMGTLYEEVQGNRYKYTESVRNGVNELYSKVHSLGGNIRDKSVPSSELSQFGFISNVSHGMELTFMEIPVEVVAEQVTRIESEIFKRIKSWEFLNQGWTKHETKNKISPNLTDFILLFNDISSWLSFEIFTQVKQSGRVRVVQKILELGEQFLEMKNFNGVFEVTSALHNSNISRMKSTFNSISKRHKAILSVLSDIVEISGNYSAYRAVLSQNTDHVTLPYIGMFLGDITMIEQKYQNKDTTGKINFTKRTLLVNVLIELRKWQNRSDYRIAPNSTFMEFLEFVRYNSMIDDEVAYTISSYVEPKSLIRPSMPSELSQILKNNSFPDNDLTASYSLLFSNPHLFSYFEMYLISVGEEQNLYFLRDAISYSRSKFNYLIISQALSIAMDYLGYGTKQFMLSLIDQNHFFVINALDTVARIENLSTGQVSRDVFLNLINYVTEKLKESQWNNFCIKYVENPSLFESAQRTALADRFDDLMHDDDLFFDFFNYLGECMSNEYLECWKDIHLFQKNNCGIEDAMEICSKWFGYMDSSEKVVIDNQTALQEIFSNLNAYNDAEYNELFSPLVTDVKNVISPHWATYCKIKEPESATLIKRKRTKSKKVLGAPTFLKSLSSGGSSKNPIEYFGNVFTNQKLFDQLTGFLNKDSCQVEIKLYEFTQKLYKIECDNIEEHWDTPFKYLIIEYFGEENISTGKITEKETPELVTMAHEVIQFDLLHWDIFDEFFERIKTIMYSKWQSYCIDAAQKSKAKSLLSTVKSLKKSKKLKEPYQRAE